MDGLMELITLEASIFGSLAGVLSSRFEAISSAEVSCPPVHPAKARIRHPIRAVPLTQRILIPLSRAKDVPPAYLPASPIRGGFLMLRSRSRAVSPP